MSEDFMRSAIPLQIQSERKKSGKERLKEALRREIIVRQKIETDMQGLQQEFDNFKKEMGVE